MGWAGERGIALPFVPTDYDQAFHMFYLLMQSREQRSRFIQQLRERGVQAVFHYLPLHSAPMGLRLGGRSGQCPVTESVSDRLVRLPFYNSLADEEQERVIAAVLEFHQ